MADQGQEDRGRRVRSARGQRLAAVLFLGLGLLAVVVGGGAALRAAQLDYVYPPDLGVAVGRRFEPADFDAVPPGGAITVTVSITNDADVDLRGFYYSDQVPNGWPVQTVAVLLDGSPLPDYSYEVGGPDEIYHDFTPHRWALELPEGGGVFSPTNPIPADGGTAQMIYRLVVSGGVGGDYAADQDGWAGWLSAVPTGTAIFGYEGPGPGPSPTPSPSPSATPTSTPSPSATPTATPSSSATPTATATVTDTPSPTPPVTGTPTMTPEPPGDPPDAPFRAYLPLVDCRTGR